MEIRVSQESPYAYVPDAGHLAWVAEFFDTPSTIFADGIGTIGKIDTIVLDNLCTFECNGHRYLYFEDNVNRDLDYIYSSLHSVAAIKDLKGDLCCPKELSSDDGFGVSPDLDWDCYFYLWYCERTKCKLGI